MPVWDRCGAESQEDIYPKLDVVPACDLGYSTDVTVLQKTFAALNQSTGLTQQVQGVGLLGIQGILLAKVLFCLYFLLF